MDNNKIVKSDNDEKGAAIRDGQSRKYLTTRNLVTGSMATLVILAGGGGFWALVWASTAFDKLPEAVSFVAQNGINLLVFVAVALTVILMTRQWLAMEDAVKHAAKQTEISREKMISDQRAYIGEVVLNETVGSKNFTIQYGNSGKLAAKEVIVYADMILLAPKWLVEKHPNDLSEGVGLSWWFNRGRIPLTDHVEIPLDDVLNEVQLKLINGARMRLIAQVRIKYEDGFGNEDWSERAFRYHAGKWLTWSMWRDGTLKWRIGEEQARYHPKDDGRD